MEIFFTRQALSVCQKYDEEKVDVIVDGPGNYFWREMSEYWPNAKIILTTRDNEEKVSRKDHSIVL